MIATAFFHSQCLGNFVLARKNKATIEQKERGKDRKVPSALVPATVPTWSYSEAPGYKGQPKKSSAMTHPRDHMSIASQKGKPRMISGALQQNSKRERTGHYNRHPYDYERNRNSLQSVFAFFATETIGTFFCMHTLCYMPGTNEQRRHLRSLHLHAEDAFASWFQPQLIYNSCSRC